MNEVPTTVRYDGRPQRYGVRKDGTHRLSVQGRWISAPFNRFCDDTLRSIGGGADQLRRNAMQYTRSGGTVGDRIAGAFNY